MAHIAVTLEGGPHDGRKMEVDRYRDIIFVADEPEFKPWGWAPDAVAVRRELTIHVYQRARYRPRVFTYQGVRP